MSRIRSKDMKPELVVRRLVHGTGYRYRLHRKDLPGKPDLVFGPRRKAIFVHGCFWHQHPGCRKATVPNDNREKWEAKLSRNVERDAENIDALKRAGWSVSVVWECDSRDPDAIVSSLAETLPSIRDRAQGITE